MFQFPEFPPDTLSIHVSVIRLLRIGFPHSDIKGSMPACGSPLLFAACHVLLRRLVPWHPPCALVRLITLLRRVTIFRSNFDFLFATGLLRLLFSSSLCAVVKVRGLSSCPFRIQNPENDTEFRATVPSQDTPASRLCPFPFGLSACLLFHDFRHGSTSV